ncbi:MAG: M23 family metallopeptidase [Clostridia bacterium]|nr:M23 family metallopeptidase [Clostridia bacterium]
MAMTEADKIRKAEEIYYRRNGIKVDEMVNKEKKSGSFFLAFLRKCFFVIAVVGCVYGYQNRDYLMSEDFHSDLRNILTTQVDFQEILNRIMNVEVDNKFEEKEKEEKNTVPEAMEIVGNYTYIMPIDGELTSGFGYRDSENPNVAGVHTGIDIAGDVGKKIVASSYGKVIEVSSEGGYGNHIKIENKDIIMLYAHCNQIYVSEGDVVTQGQEIAEVGITGNTTGPHLHFEIRRNNVPEDPFNYIDLCGGGL